MCEIVKLVPKQVLFIKEHFHFIVGIIESIIFMGKYLIALYMSVCEKSSFLR